MPSEGIRGELRNNVIQVHRVRAGTTVTLSSSPSSSKPHARRPSTLSFSFSPLLSLSHSPAMAAAAAAAPPSGKRAASPSSPTPPAAKRTPAAVRFPHTVQLTIAGGNFNFPQTLLVRLTAEECAALKKVARWLVCVGVVPYFVLDACTATHGEGSGLDTLRRVLGCLTAPLGEERSGTWEDVTAVFFVSNFDTVNPASHVASFPLAPPRPKAYAQEKRDAFPSSALVGYEDEDEDEDAPRHPVGGYVRLAVIFTGEKAFTRLIFCEYQDLKKWANDDHEAPVGLHRPLIVFKIEANTAEALCSELQDATFYDSPDNISSVLFLQLDSEVPFTD